MGYDSGSLLLGSVVDGVVLSRVWVWGLHLVSPHSCFFVIADVVDTGSIGVLFVIVAQVSDCLNRGLR